MDFEKTIMDLLKKYVEETAEKKQKEDNDEKEQDVQNAEIDANKTDKTAIIDEILTPKTENYVLDESKNIGQSSESFSQNEADENAAKEEANDEEVLKNENVSTDPDSDPYYKNTFPKTWQEAEDLLNIVDNSYSEILPEAVDAEEQMTFERKEQPTETDEDVETAVKERVDLEKQQAIDEVDAKVDQKVEDAMLQKKTIENKYTSKADTTNTAFNAARVKAENDALKRGLARSSIVCLELDGLEKSRREELGAQAEKLAEELEAVENKLNSLEADRTLAIEKLNVSYAAKLQTEISKELQKLQKRRDEVVEYNNKVAELEQKYREKASKSYAGKVAEAENRAKELNEKQERAKQNEQIALLTNYFSQFNTKEAVDELKKHSEIANKYGVDVYYRVYRNIIKTK